MLYLLVGSVTVDGLFFGVMCPCLIIYATDVLRIEEFEWALLLAWLSAVTICSALPSGKLIDGFGRRAVGQLIGGFLYDHVSPPDPIPPSAGIVVPYSLLILFLVSEPKERRCKTAVYVRRASFKPLPSASVRSQQIEHGWYGHDPNAVQIPLHPPRKLLPSR